MPEASEPPPPSQTALAAAAGGFGGAVLGVIAATMLMGNGDSDKQATNSAGQEPVVEMLAARDSDEQ